MIDDGEIVADHALVAPGEAAVLDDHYGGSPGGHGAEHVQAILAAPVDGQGVAWRPHRRPASPVVARLPAALGFGRQPAEVAGGAVVAGLAGLRQQALGADAAPRGGHPAGDHGGDTVVVASSLGARRAGGAAGHVAQDGPLHGLVVNAAHGGGSSIGAYLSVGGNHVHVFLR